MDCSFNISTQKGNHCYQKISAQADKQINLYDTNH